MSIEKDFENSLIDYITSSNDAFGRNHKKDMDLLKYRTYVSQGVNYRIPVAVRKPQWNFRSIKISYNGKEIDSTSLNQVLVEADYPGFYNKMYVELDRVCRGKAIRKEKGIVVSLYREGMEEPLAVVALDPESPSALLWTGDDRTLSAGNYFILVSNAEACEKGESHFDMIGNSMRYCFRIVPHGKSLEHPTVEFLDFTLKKGVFLMVEDGKIGKQDFFSLYAYNSVGRVMAKVVQLPVHEGGFQEIHVPLKSKEWWLNDEYTLVMTHNDEPFSIFTFQWKYDRIVGCPTSQPLASDSIYYRMAKQTRKEPDWISLSAISGYASIRDRLSVLLEEAKDERVLRCAISSEQELNFKAVKCISNMVVPSHFLASFDCQLLVDDGSYLTENQKAVFYHLSSLLYPEGHELLSYIESRLETDPQFSLVLWGTSIELEQLFDRSPILSQAIKEENRWKVQPLTLTEQINEFRTQIEDTNLKFSYEAQEKLIRKMTEQAESLKDWGAEEISACVEKVFIPRFRKRIAECRSFDFSQDYFTTLEEEDILLPEETCRKGEFEDSLEELNGMVGLASLKRGLITTFNRTRFEEKRKVYGFPVPERGGHHMIFTGNPGTGKTTVAKLVGRIFHAMGILSNGEVIEAERTNMVGRYIGETEQNMAELLGKAKGNVLFIDEAYSLCDNGDGNRQDFGCRVLESLLTVLSQKNPDMIIILAGYEKEMEQMLEMNPGMKGRFPYKFNFEDYNADELYQIACHLFSRSGYVLTPEADALFRETIQETVAHKDAYFHNARWVEQYVWDGIIAAMANRVMGMSVKVDSRELFQTIEAQDIKEAYQKMKPHSIAVMKRRIGFVA